MIIIAVTSFIFFLTQLLKQSLADNKPLVERLNKTGSALLKLVGEEDANRLHDNLDEDNQRYEAIKNAIRERSNSLEEALQETSEVRFQLI